MGGVPGPLDCFLVLRGLRTLHLRVERSSANALTIARFLAARPDVARVAYPGLADAGATTGAGSPLVGSQMRLGGGMVSFLPAAGGRHDRTPTERAVAVAERTRLFTLAESLGGVESLIEVPAAMTHMSVSGSPLEVDPALVRLSVGIEGVEDLVADLRQALDEA
jgi:cystathionine beta-lyase/cystathionine gamma-synthase